MYKNSEGPIRVPFELSALVVFSLATPTFFFLYLGGTLGPSFKLF